MPVNAGYRATSDNTVMLRFGRRLRDLRKQQGWTQVQMSLLLKVDRAYLSNVERGVKSISLPMIQHIAHGMGKTVIDLLKDL